MKIKSEISNMFTLLLSTTLLASCSGLSDNQTGTATVSGKLSNSSGEIIYLQDLNKGRPINLDSVKLGENGTFEFHTKVPSKGFYTLKLSDTNYATLVLDPSDKVSITGDAKSLGYTYKAEGSADTKLFIDFNNYGIENRKKLTAIKQKQDSIQGVFTFYANQNKDQKKLDSLSKILEPIFNKYSQESVALVKEADQYACKFIDKNPASYTNLAVVQIFSDKEANISYFEKVSATLRKKYPEQKNLQNFSDYVTNMKKLAVGSVVPEIKLNNTDGKEIALSSLRGKIVLIDFWASWCGPCRKENPNVVKIYADYHKKGFEVFGVSLDKDKAAWIKAIGDDNLTWIHVSDLGGWQSSVVPQFEIKGIPMTVLIDKQGKILAKNLRGEQLTAKIAELLK